MVAVAVLAILGYGAMVIASGADVIWRDIGRLQLAGALLIVLLSGLNYAIRSVRWRDYLKRLDCRLTVAANSVCYLAGFAFTLTPGKAGEAGRAVHLKRYGVPYGVTFAALLVERLMDLMAVVILALLAAAPLSGSRWLIGVALALTFLVAAVLASLNRLVHGLGIRVRGRWAKLCTRALPTVESIAPLLRGPIVSRSLILSVCAWAAEAFGFYWLCLQLDVALNPLTAGGIYAVSLLAGALSFLPGGLGTTEATMAGLLMTVGGTSQGTAVAVTLICRVLTLWLAVALGILCNLWLETSLAPKPVTQKA